MKILLIEDEFKLAESIIQYLSEQSILCEWVNNFKEAKLKITQYEYDCILLDLMLPDGNGMKLIDILKQQNKTDALIIISAKDSIDVKIEGLQKGADDYLTKPFHLSELAARIYAIIRRKKFDGNNLIVFNEIQINLLSRQVMVNHMPIDLTKKEFDLLMYFISNKNKVLTKSAIAEHLSGDMADMLDNFDFIYAHIKNLKNKLKSLQCKDYIKTIYGIGYKWQDD